MDVDWECTRFFEVELDILYIGEIGFSVEDQFHPQLRGAIGDIKLRMQNIHHLPKTSSSSSSGSTYESVPSGKTNRNQSSSKFNNARDDDSGCYKLQEAIYRIWYI